MRWVYWLGAFGSLGSSIGHYNDAHYDHPAFAHRGRKGYGTGWRTRKFQHPEGPCSFRPTGIKRTRRRQFGKAYGRWTDGGARRFVEDHIDRALRMAAADAVDRMLDEVVRPVTEGLLPCRKES